MASLKALNARNLERLGATRLAALLIEVSTGNAVAQRRLRLELAGEAGGDEAARAIGRRLATIARAKTIVDWRRTRALVVDLEVQRRAILDHVARTDPKEAFALFWRFLGLAESIFARCDDGGGRVRAVFDAALGDLGPLAAAAKIAPDRLAATVLGALRSQSHGQFDGLIPALAAQLGPAGLDALQAGIAAWRDDAIGTRDHHGRIEALRRRRALEQIADARQDVDAYIAAQGAEATDQPAAAAAIAARLIAAGRAAEAVQRLDAAAAGRPRPLPDAWQEARLAALDALGQHDEAQADRWAWFAASLRPDPLRDYLRKLPAFEDFDAEARALAHAAAFPDVHRAATFLIEWPAPDRAAALVRARSSELDGDRYETLAPLAEALAARHPLAAMIALRAMIDFTLGHARSSRYRHAMRHLRACAALAAHVDDFGAVPDHAAYEHGLRARHGRKTGFWQSED